MTKVYPAVKSVFLLIYILLICGCGTMMAKMEANKTQQKTKPVKLKPTKSTKNKNIKSNDESLNVSVRLATFTLVNVLKNQALFYQALEVLDLLEKKGEDPDMIRLERDSIKNLIKSSEKEDNKK